jgi:hypothetical protein
MAGVFDAKRLTQQKSNSAAFYVDAESNDFPQCSQKSSPQRCPALDGLAR